MEEKTDAIFNEVVFAVTCLLFSDEAGTLTIWQNLIRASLDSKQLKQRIREIVEN